MSNLHAYFALKNEQAFSKLLEAAKSRKQSSTPSSSLGKRSLPLPQDVDVNAKDWLGRTVLHLVCSTVEPYALTYIKMLLSHPAVNVNVQDVESKWTPLHRALYCGNLSACQLLLKRPDIDTQIRDNEGLTSFELYNLTQERAWPVLRGNSLPRQNSDFSADFLTWGGNRNATLGHSDSNDRSFPDHVIIPRTNKLDGGEKFSLIQVKAVSMAKLHTTVITNEIGHNLRICGFGSGGRLGHAKHTLYNLQHVPQLTHPVASVVAVQDHTLALTSRGEVWSWGLNRFSQLGYVIESSTPGHKSSEEPIQAVPRRVLGPLKKEEIAGVAASKVASACWTLKDGDVFTWGTNNGQLGYDSSSQPVQILPRKTTGVQNVIDIAFTDSAMACLLHTGDVICFHDDIRFRVMFSVSNPSGFSPYIPPSASRSPIIVKVTGCEGTFAALSARGDVWTFPASSRSSIASESKDSKTKDRVAVKPQRVWTTRRLGDSAKDIALGTNGDIIICTESGQVFTRSRTASSITPKLAGTVTVSVKGTFFRVPFIHRAVHVYANSAGGFGALRSNYLPQAVVIRGNTLQEDIGTIRPWVSTEDGLVGEGIQAESTIDDHSERGDHEFHCTSEMTTKRLLALLLANEKGSREIMQDPTSGELKYGSNMIFRTDIDVPVHRVLLAARSPLLRTIFASNRRHFRNGSILIEYTHHESKSSATLSVLKISGIQSLTVLLLLEFFYTDTLPTLNNTLPFENAMQIRREFSQLTSTLEIDYLFTIGDTGITVRAPTLGQHLLAIFDDCQKSEDGLAPTALCPDVFIDLMDRRIACHSTILRSRCIFFTYFFEEDAWTANRWSPEKTITINMKHMEWRGFFYVMKWIYSDGDETLFNNLDDGLDTVQNFIDLIFEVISIASELLLDRLMLVCSVILLRLVTVSNAPSLLFQATHYNVLPLVASLQDYIACNLEAILESQLLDSDREREYDVEGLMPALGAAIRSRQANSFPHSRAGRPDMDELMRRHAGWLELQDIPGPMVRSQRVFSEQQSPRLMPTPGGNSLTTQKLIAEEYIFQMDENTTVAPVANQLPESSASGGPAKKVWKSKTVHDLPKVNFKTVMAETAAQAVSVVTTGERSLLVDPSNVQPLRTLPIAPPSYLPTSLLYSSEASSWNQSTQCSSVAAHLTPTSSHGHRGAASNSAKSPIEVEPVKPVSALSTGSSSSPNSTKYPILLRRGSNDAPAWSSKLPNRDLSSPVAGLSFTAIQQQQLAQVRSAQEKPILRQIQEEERARKEEEDFLKWWAAEEERFAKRVETDLGSGSNLSGSNSRSRSRKHRGKGRGEGSKDTGS